MEIEENDLSDEKLKAIRKQLEFYVSGSNLIKDKFLQE